MVLGSRHAFAVGVCHKYQRNCVRRFLYPTAWSHEVKFVFAFLALVSLATTSLAADGVRPLVNVGWFVDHLARPGVVIVDTRSRAEYDAGHVTGAVHTDYGRDGWRVTDANGTPGMFPDDAVGLTALAARIGEMGIGNDSHVVLVPRGHDEIDLGVFYRIP